nr:uncharacterized protein LOC111506597 isoform X1 [Leptinotarsa decemlineata]
MLGYIFLLVTSIMICSTIPQHGIANIKNGRLRRSNQDCKSHNHGYNHGHRHNQGDRMYPTWPFQTRSERSPLDLHSNKPIATSQYRKLAPLSFNITLVPVSSLKNNTRKITPVADPVPVLKHVQHVGTESNADSDKDSRNIINLSIIREIFFINITENEKPENNSKMAFPNDDKFHHSRKINSRNCTFGLCEVVDDYPEEQVNRLVSRSKELKQYFKHIEITHFDNRFGDGDQLCSTISHTVFPKSATNTKNVEMFLVNVGEFKQGVVFETCAREGGSCSFSDIFPMGYSTTCSQKYTVRRLMAVEKESDSPVFDNFQLPSCCVCTVKKNIPT